MQIYIYIYIYTILINQVSLVNLYVLLFSYAH